MINDLDEDDMLMQSAIAGDSLRLNTYLKSKFYQVREGDCHTSIVAQSPSFKFLYMKTHI